MLCPPLTPAPIVTDWVARHRDLRNFALHIVGIPATILGGLFPTVALICLSWQIFLFGLAVFVGGYALQFLGHAIDGTEVGEIAALKKKLKGSRPQVAPESA